MTAPLIDRLAAQTPDLRGRLLAGQPLGPLTWFRVGGPAEVLFTPGRRGGPRLFPGALPRRRACLSARRRLQHDRARRRGGGRGGAPAAARLRAGERVRRRGERRGRRARQARGGDRFRGRNRRARVLFRHSRLHRRGDHHERRGQWWGDEGRACRSARRDPGRRDRHALQRGPALRIPQVASAGGLHLHLRDLPGAVEDKEAIRARMEAVREHRETARSRSARKPAARRSRTRPSIRPGSWWTQPAAGA